MQARVPKYVKIKTDIINKIKAGELKPGDKIPSESSFKKEYGVSTITVRKAFTDLINDGILTGVQGLGTFVARKEMIRGLTSIDFSEELKQQGYEVDLTDISIEKVINEYASNQLKVEKNAELYEIKRVRLANDNPIAYHISYIPCKNIQKEDLEKIKTFKYFYKTLNEAGIYPEWVNENYSVKKIKDDRIAKAMKLKLGDSAFFVKRIAFDDAGDIIEYAETYFNPNEYSVTVNIKF